jgi:hypothetical protein
MKKTLFVFVIGMAMFVFSDQALALSVQVLPDGNIEFVYGDVLGKDWDENRNKKEDNLRERKPEARRERREIKRGDDDTRASRSKKREAGSKREIRSGVDKEIRIRADKDDFRVELKDRFENRQDNDQDRNQRLQRIEEIRDDEVNISLPAGLKLDKETDREEIKARLKAKAKRKLDGRPEEIDEQLLEKRANYQEEIRKQRQERKDELIEIRNKLKDNKQTLELESRKVKAALKNGAEFSLDPTTNEVTVVTPSGETHLLNHLPDQALERMKATGLFSDTSSSDKQEVEVETTANGDLVYKKRDKIKKKLFGLFPREIESEIILNDSTGEVIEEPLPPTTFFGQFFNSLSF